MDEAAQRFSPRSCCRSGPARMVADVYLFLPSVLVCKEIDLLSSIQ